jgi:hypothetical protein
MARMEGDHSSQVQQVQTQEFEEFTFENQEEFTMHDITDSKGNVSLLISLWQDQPGEYFCISTGKRVKLGQKCRYWKDKFFARDEFDQIPAYIAANVDREIYACPHGFNARQRKGHSVRPNWLTPI